MKKNSLLLISLFFSLLAMAQAPGAFNFQGVARNANGQPYASQTINVRLTIHTGTATGNIEYGEVRSVSTNAFGLFNIQVGSAGANTTQGSFSTISWGTEPKYLQTEINLPGNMSYIDMGTVAMQSVPYAIHSKEAADIKMPFEKTMNNSGSLFSLTNSSGETSSAAAFLNSNVGYSLHASSESGTAVKAISSFGTALETEGGVRIFGGNTNPGTYKVLTSDAFGNASWQQNNAMGFRFPIDTTVNVQNETPLIHIKNLNNYSTSAIAHFENRKGSALFANSDSGIAISAFSKSNYLPAILGNNGGGGHGVAGYANAGNNTAGVLGDGQANSIGVKGVSNNYMGVAGISTNQIGVYAASTNGIGMEAVSTNSNAVYGISSIDHGIIGLSGTSAKAGVVGGSLATGGIGLLGEGSTVSSIGVKAKGIQGATALEVDGAIKIYGAGQYAATGKVLTSDANGVATWKHPFETKQIGFSVRNANPTMVAPNTWVKVPFASELFDGSNNYTTPAQSPASTFKTPVRGLYHISTQVAFKDAQPFAIRVNLRIVYKRNGVTSVMTVRQGFIDNADNNTTFTHPLSVSISGDFYFQANDEVWIEIAQANEIVLPGQVTLALAENESCFFSGHLIFED